MNQTNDEIEIDIDVTHYNSSPCNLNKNSFANILYLKARSLRNSFNDVQNYIETQTFKIHIIVISETWLTNEDTQYFNFHHYQAFHSVRKNGRGGVVSIIF